MQNKKKFNIEWVEYFNYLLFISSIILIIVSPYDNITIYDTNIILISINSIILITTLLQIVVFIKKKSKIKVEIFHNVLFSTTFILLCIANVFKLEVIKYIAIALLIPTVIIAFYIGNKEKINKNL